jgi:hypothetical protein
MQLLLQCLVMFACSLVVGCRDSIVQTELRPLSVVVSGDTQGWIVPCGCTSNQSGGLPYRGAFLQHLSQSTEVVFVDVGGAASGTTPYDRAKFDAILAGEVALGVAAHNIGASEAAMGSDHLRVVADRLGVPFVSCNVRDAAGSLVAEPVRVVKHAGRRLALIGVLSETYEGAGLRVDPPRDAVLAALQSIDQQFDSAIVLAYLGADELAELAGGLPEVDIVIGGPTGQSIAPRRIGATLLSSATNKGKFIVRLDAPEPETNGGWSGRAVEMTAEWGGDPRMDNVLAAFYAELAAKDFTPAQTSLQMSLPTEFPAEYLIAGTVSCRGCHKEDCRPWDESAHARAWVSLWERGAHVDPYCQQCHTTGYGLPGGFRSAKRTPQRKNVGCESCHGPSMLHAESPETRTGYYDQAANRCVHCHDRENSPEFVYDTYWPRIRHGGAATFPPAGPSAGTDKAGL